MKVISINATCPSGQHIAIDTDSVEMASSLAEYLMGAIRPDVFLTYVSTLQPDALPVAQMAVKLCEGAMTVTMAAASIPQPW